MILIIFGSFCWLLKLIQNPGKSRKYEKSKNADIAAKYQKTASKMPQNCSKSWKMDEIRQKWQGLPYVFWIFRPVLGQLWGGICIFPCFRKNSRNKGKVWKRLIFQRIFFKIDIFRKKDGKKSDIRRNSEKKILILIHGPRKEFFVDFIFDFFGRPEYRS